MTDPTPTQSATGWRILAFLGLAGVAVGLAYAGVKGFNRSPNATAEPPPVGGLPLFNDWPADTKPDAVVILSGQSFGFLQPCGCSRPQMGGLERRANFINSLKSKGWPVVGVDLGDLYPAKGPVKEQSLLKYKTAMTALREMGYVAIGLGKTEFDAGTITVLAEYALQKEQPPFVLAGNLVGMFNGEQIPRDKAFPGPGQRPMIGSTEVFDVKGTPISITGVIGKPLGLAAAKADPSIAFLDVKEFLTSEVTRLAADQRKPVTSILLYQGPIDHARLLAKDFPQFQVILCQIDESEPPLLPETVQHAGGGRTWIIQVGHKGRFVGVLGVFKKAGGVDLKYQLVPLGEEYLTPNDPASESANPILPLLEKYAEQVRDRNFLAKVQRTPHPSQIHAPNANLSFVGSDACKVCHPADYQKWQASNHGHALDALEKVAKRPSLRNFDAECVVCHTVGHGYRTGYESAEKTPALKHVGCETCHGPGSGHAAAPRDPEFRKLMSPWKQQPGDRLPDLATFEKLANVREVDRSSVAIPAAQQQVINAVSSACMKCHDSENDPHFDLYKYWPKIVHGQPDNGGLPPPRR